MSPPRKRYMATVYVEGEGREHLDRCLASTLEHCRRHNILTVVIYTASGDGVIRAMEMAADKPAYGEIRFVAVTPPMNRLYVADPREDEPEVVFAGITGERRRVLHKAGVPILSVRLPFQSMLVGEPLADPWQLVDRAFGILGGGFSLCVQSVLVACDAGAVQPGERVASMTADTSIVALASHTETFLSPRSGLLLEHVICRPSLYDISKRDHRATKRAIEEASPQEELPLLESGDDD